MTDLGKEREAQDIRPNVLSCPECGSPRRPGDFDPEGVCECVNGHQFWDTNSPEWQIIRRLQRAERALAAREDWIAERSNVEKGRDEIRAALSELVRLYDLKSSDRVAYALEDKGLAWAAARRALMDQ